MRRARKITVAIVVLAAFAFLLPPFINANRFRKRLAASASGALGRSVTLGDVRVQLLPRPGFEIKTFVVGDDPAFSAEPLLRSDQVTATLRILSLWRGKFEIAELDFKYPSLNLVQNKNGDWNIESLLRYTSSLRAAPTGRAKAQAAPRFPYIQATSGRINFKMLQEKKVHALVDADFALWLESENQWNMRLEARPMRTDANLLDTGTLRMEGSMQRGETLGRSPLQMHLSLVHSQLGQLSALLSGKDHGWRGDVELDALGKGTAEKLAVTADAHIADFRRYDIANDGPVSLRTHCSGTLLQVSDADLRQKYGAAMLSDIDCHSAVGTGEVALSGKASVSATPNYDLKMEATSVPLSSIAASMRKVKRSIPDDLVANGLFSGTFFARKIASEDSRPANSNVSGMTVTGSGRVLNAEFTSKSLQSNINVENVSFAVESASSALKGARGSSKSKSRVTKTPLATSEDGGIAVQINPFNASLGQSDRVKCSGHLSNRSYSFQAAGEGSIVTLTAAAKTFGLANRLPYGIGHASFNISLDGTWIGFAAPAVSGTARIERVSAPLDGTGTEVRIASANLFLTPTETIVQKLVASLSGTRTTVEGSVNIPRSCEVNCPVRFDLQVNELNIGELNRILNPKFRGSTWSALGSRFLGTDKGTSKLLEFDANGRLTVNRLQMKSVTANHVSALAELKHGTAQLRNVQGEFLGGRYTGTWSADFTAAQPTYRGNGTFDSVSFTPLNTLLHTTIGGGALSRTTFDVSFSGDDEATVTKTMLGKFSFNWKDGSITRTAASAKPLQFSSWQAKGEIAGQKASLISGTLQMDTGSYVTTGGITFSRELDVRWVNPKQTISITGTVETPLIRVQDASVSVESASNDKDAKPSKTP